MTMLYRYFSFLFTIAVAFAADALVFQVPIHGDIDMGLPYFVDRAIDQAEDARADLIIFDVNTFGGRVDAAVKIKDSIMGCKIPTLAFVNRRAISAGALISLSCDMVLMTSGGTIGAATAVNQKGEKLSEKVISYMREEMASTAEANGRNPKVASAMVDEEISIDFVLAGADTVNAERISGFATGKLLTLSTETALLVGFADGKADTRSEVLAFCGLTGAEVETMAELWTETMVRFLTNPIVSPLLMTLGMLALIFEIKSPGFGFPGLFGVAALTLFFGSHLIIGLANTFEIILLLAGILFILAEVFVIPGFGIAGILGMLLSAAGFFGIMLSDHPQQGDIKNIFIGIAFSILMATLLGWFLLRLLIRSKTYERVVPNSAQKKDNGYSIAKGFEELIGQRGVAETVLRPTGIGRFNGKVLQVRSTGNFIEKGREVQVEGLDENILIVRKLD